MNENLNLVEILKDCPKGTKLYCPFYGEVEFQKVCEQGVCDQEYPINVVAYYYTEQHPNGEPVTRTFTSDGRHTTYYKTDECVLFPSKDQRDWSKFKPKKPKFDPKTLQPFDKVLVRDYSSGYWHCDFFSSIDDSTSNNKFITVSSAYKFCIPYNDITKHLVGTTEEAPEFYRYWED